MWVGAKSMHTGYETDFINVFRCHQVHLSEAMVPAESNCEKDRSIPKLWSEVYTQLPNLKEWMMHKISQSRAVNNTSRLSNLGAKTTCRDTAGRDGGAMISASGQWQRVPSNPPRWSEAPDRQEGGKKGPETDTGTGIGPCGPLTIKTGNPGKPRLVF